MLRYNMIVIKLGPNNYNGLMIDVDDVLEAKTLQQLKIKGARVLAQVMREKEDFLPNYKFDVSQIYKERTMTEISEFEMNNSEIVEIRLELRDNLILFEGRIRV